MTSRTQTPSRGVPGVLAVSSLLFLLQAQGCDAGASCPSAPCNPASDGTPFDLLDWCQTSGQCLKDGVPAPVCRHADASPPPSCALGPIDANETLTFPVGQLGAMLGGRRDLVVLYAQCEVDAGANGLSSLLVLVDGAPAACASANPCDPRGSPTVMTCPGVPSSAQVVTVSFSYAAASPKTALQVQLQNTACAYTCT